MIAPPESPMTAEEAVLAYLVLNPDEARLFRPDEWPDVRQRDLLDALQGEVEDAPDCGVWDRLYYFGASDRLYDYTAQLLGASATQWHEGARRVAERRAPRKRRALWEINLARATAAGGDP